MSYTILHAHTHACIHIDWYIYVHSLYVIWLSSQAPTIIYIHTHFRSILEIG